jgi:hypothetical protein
MRQTCLFRKTCRRTAKYAAWYGLAAWPTKRRPPRPYQDVALEGLLAHIPQAQRAELLNVLEAVATEFAQRRTCYRVLYTDRAGLSRGSHERSDHCRLGEIIEGNHIQGTFFSFGSTCFREAWLLAGRQTYAVGAQTDRLPAVHRSPTRP